MKRGTILLVMLFMCTILAAAEWKELLNKGYELTDKGSYEEAIEVYSKAIKLLPEGKGAEVYSARARSYSQMGEYISALKDLEKGNSLNPQNIYILSELIHNNQALGIFKSAHGYYEEVKKLKPSDDPFHNMIKAYILRQYGDYEEALTYIDRAIKVDPKNSYLIQGKAYILLSLEERDNKEIARLARLMTEYSPEDSRIHNSAAMIFNYLGRDKEAFKVSRRAIELDRQYVYNYITYYIIAKLSGSQKELKSALKSLKRLGKSSLKDQWTTTIRDYFTGKIDSKRLLKEAGDDNPKLCQANFYIAMHLLGEVEESTIIDYLGKATATGCSFYSEHYGAAFFSRNFEIIKQRNAVPQDIPERR